VTTSNDKHLEKHEQKGGDQPLAGAQITKPEDSAVKQRQEMLDGLKSHRITKDGNGFTLDMGNGETVQDVRGANKIAAVVEQQLGRSDAPVSIGGSHAGFHDSPPAQILPGEGDYMPKPGGDFPLPHGGDFPLPHGGDFPPPQGGDWQPIPPGDLSKFTIKTDTTIDKNGHIVTTETRADGSTLATAQSIGADSKLHVVSTELNDGKGNTTTEKFDPATGKKTEEIKDNIFEKTDTKFNATGQPESKDTINKVTGQTDHEIWMYANGGAFLHTKNGEPVVEDKLPPPYIPDFYKADGVYQKPNVVLEGEQLKHNVAEQLSEVRDQSGEKGLSAKDAANAASEALSGALAKYGEKYLLLDYTDPKTKVHQHYNPQTFQWTDDLHKPIAPPPQEAYKHNPEKGDSVMDAPAYAFVLGAQAVADQLRQLAAFFPADPKPTQ
jgi:hypothetical protein